MIFGMDLSGCSVTKDDVSEVEYTHFCHLRQTVNKILYCHNFTHACHIFPLSNMFLHETNTFYCVILLTFLLKIVNVQRCPVLGQKCSLGGWSF
jgi:hypothetical protein